MSMSEEIKDVAHGLVEILHDKLDSIDIAFAWGLRKFEVIIKEKKNEGIRIETFDIIRNYLTKNEFEVFRISTDENNCIVISSWVRE
jgi:hypothetical protein